MRKEIEFDCAEFGWQTQGEGALSHCFSSQRVPRFATDPLRSVRAAFR